MSNIQLGRQSFWSQKHFCFYCEATTLAECHILLIMACSINGKKHSHTMQLEIGNISTECCHQCDGSFASTPSYVGHINVTGPEPELLSSVSPTQHNTPRRGMLL